MVMVEETYMPLTLFAPDITDEHFDALCDQYADYRLEYSADGEIIIMPPTDPRTGIRNAAITKRLGILTDAVQRGFTTDSSSGFVLPSNARRSPDSAWISSERLDRRPTCPEFVIELLSPSDRPKKVHEKMLEWIANGAELGWLTDPFHKTVAIYR